MSLLVQLVAALGLSQAEIMRIATTAPARYKVYQIPKRDGGSRTIAQPSRELKAIQRFILHEKLSLFPIHEKAMAYVEGRNIWHNAEIHKYSNCILKLDFENFFPSIKVADWEKFAKRNPVLGVDLRDIKIYSQLLFWGETARSRQPRCLSIGAPTSPAISNLLLFGLDQQLTEAANAFGVAYTRYADDITASAPNVDSLKNFEKAARRIVKGQKTPKLTFNEEKRGLFRKGERRLVTGLVITPMQTVSVGRARKRLISAMLHRSSKGLLDPRERSELKGLLGFCVANEGGFVERMREKYGNTVVTSAMQFHAPRRRELAGA
jgi:RNA-directed DNA polymerase